VFWIEHRERGTQLLSDSCDQIVNQRFRFANQDFSSQLNFQGLVLGVVSGYRNPDFEEANRITGTT